MSPARRAWCLAAGVCALVLAADQIVKAVVEAQLEVGQHVDVVGPFGLTLSHNAGVAFGLAGGGGGALIAITIVALAVVGILFAREPTRPGLWLAAALLAGGALGNLIDRVRAGVVTDYIDIGSWPNFNLADIAITVGVVLLAISFLSEAAD